MLSRFLHTFLPDTSPLVFIVLCTLNYPMFAIDGFKSFGSDSSFVQAHVKPSQIISSFKGENITIDVDNDSVANIYVVSSATTSHKYLILFHEWWGLNQHIRKTADSFRDSLPGVNVIAVDLYDGKVATESEQASLLMGSISEQACTENYSKCYELLWQKGGDMYVGLVLWWRLVFIRSH